MHKLTLHWNSAPGVTERLILITYPLESIVHPPTSHYDTVVNYLAQHKVAHQFILSGFITHIPFKDAKLNFEERGITVIRWDTWNTFEKFFAPYLNSEETRNYLNIKEVFKFENHANIKKK